LAKRTYKILRFDGGINNDADPRDIGDNQFSELQNVAIDEMGKIIVLGDVQTTQNNGQALSVSGNLTGAGRGFFACTTDHTGLLDGGLDNVGQTYYLVENGDQVTGLGSTDESGNIACNMNEASMYYVDGALRIAEADVTSADVTPIWRGFIEANTYMPGAGGGDVAIPESWSTVNAEIAGAFPTFSYNDTTICKNALMINVTYSANQQEYGFDRETVYTLDASFDGTNDAPGNSGFEWGFALEFAESVIGNGTGTWMPNDTVRYKFYITTMYDNQTQESLPQLLRMWDTEQTSPNVTFEGQVITTELAFRAGNSTTAGENVAVHFKPVFKVVGAAAFNWGAPNLTDEGSGNKRISGARIYWASNEDGYTTLWQIFDAKFDEGCKVIGVDGGGGGTSGYAPWEDAADGHHVQVALSTDNVWTNPPRYFQYDVLNAHTPTDVIKVDAYKAAVVANRRVYLGNVKQDGKIHGDRMLKSPVNQFDKFPSVNNIDVAIHDGDDIVALVEYADRILQFKKNTCYIINISGSAEYLEAEHKFKGITNPGAACRTDYGAAWANQNGCYMYDGQAVTDLLEDQGMRKINQSTWSTFIGTGNYHRIGFNPFKRQLVVLQGTTGYNAYVYDMVTKSWTFSSYMVSDGDTGSNFINDPVDGSLLIFNDAGHTIDKWANTPVGDTTPPIVIATKDIDFGEPAVRKKLYKIYVTYKGDGTSITENYRTNGGTTDYGFDAGFGNVSVWTRLELKPDTSSEAKSIYSCQLRLTGSCATDFMINDISFIYRSKGIK
jgi:hypothetical protein